jgi:hypothetical protein
MFCPRCGTENDDGNRFCVSCGVVLASKQPRKSGDSTDGPGEDAPAPARGRLDEVIGTSRRARIVTALTVVAIAVAVVAFIVLRSNDSDEGVQQDAYLTNLDRQCVQEKARISELENTTLRQESPDFATFVNFLVRDVTEWHSGLQSTPPPAAHVEGVRAVEGALLEVLIAAGRLGTAVRGGSQAEIVRTAQRVDVATGQVDPALEFLGLEKCANVVVQPQQSAG